MTPEEAAAKLAAGEAKLLDVREPDEITSASIEGAQCIPMGEIPDRIDELDRDQPLIIMCHLGGRSAKVCEYLLSQGFTDISNLSGGITAWAETDPDAVNIR